MADSLGTIDETLTGDAPMSSIAQASDESQQKTRIVLGYPVPTLIQPMPRGGSQSRGSADRRLSGCERQRSLDEEAGFSDCLIR